MIGLTLLTRKKLNSRSVANWRHRENDDTPMYWIRRTIKSVLFRCYKICFTHVIIVLHVLHTLCVYFTKEGPVRLKFPILKSVTISFAFKRSRKVFLFSRYLEQINCKISWNKLPAKQNWIIHSLIYKYMNQVLLIAFTYLANWLDTFSIWHV